MRLDLAEVVFAELSVKHELLSSFNEDVLVVLL